MELVITSAVHALSDLWQVSVQLIRNLQQSTSVVITRSPRHGHITLIWVSPNGHPKHQRTEYQDGHYPEPITALNCKPSLRITLVSLPTSNDWSKQGHQGSVSSPHLGTTAESHRSFRTPHGVGRGFFETVSHSNFSICSIFLSLSFHKYWTQQPSLIKVIHINLRVQFLGT